jgi:hypothetical protein
MRVVIHFLHAKNMNAAQILRELCAAVYGQNVMSEGTASQRRRMFKDGRKIFRCRAKWSAICSEYLVQSVDQEISERRRFAISEHLREFPQIITVRVGYHEFCVRWVPKMLKGAHETQNGFVFGFLERNHKDSDELLIHIVRVTGDET